MPSRAEQREDTHARVLSAASRQFYERGFTQTTIRDIAQAAGVSTGTVMLVGDKPALLVHAFDEQIARIHAERHDAHLPTGIPAQGAAGQILGLLTPFLDLFTSRGDLARVYASILVEGRTDSTLFTDLAATLISEMAQVLRAGLAESKAVSLARSIYLAYIGTLFTWPRSLDTDTAALSASLLETITVICERKAVNA